MSWFMILMPSGMMFDVEVMTDEVMAVLQQVNQALEPSRFGFAMRRSLQRAFGQQIREAFASEAAPESGAWAPLSDWRVDERGGDAHPILYDSGELYGQATNYKGRLRITGGHTGFSFWFPDHVEMSPKAWGLFAGQRINPLGATPLSAVPRRVLGDVNKQQRDTVEAIAGYLRASGFEVTFG
jgi:hypothetical protein